MMGKSGLASAQYAVLETKDDLDNAKLDILEHVLGEGALYYYCTYLYCSPHHV